MYLSQDLTILDEMIQDTAKTKLIQKDNKNQVILTETQGTDYAVTITHIPQNTIIIKPDFFCSTANIFSRSAR